MPGKRFTAERIVAKLREAEKLQGRVDDPDGAQAAACSALKTASSMS